MQYIIRVDEDDNTLGPIEKMEAHIRGVLHRAFSILVFNAQAQLLLQKRHRDKYHSGGLWTNTCCSHPRYGEDLESAVHRRLQEEMGFDCQLKEVFSFTYRAEFDSGLIEYEFDHVFIGLYDGAIFPHAEEVEDYKWVDLEEIQADVERNPDLYTYWFRDLLKRVNPTYLSSI